MIERYNEVLEKIESVPVLKRAFSKAIAEERRAHIDGATLRILKRIELEGADVPDIQFMQKFSVANAKALKNYPDPVLQHAWGVADSAAKLTALSVVARGLQDAGEEADFKKTVSRILKQPLGAQFESFMRRDLE